MHHMRLHPPGRRTARPLSYLRSPEGEVHRAEMSAPAGKVALVTGGARRIGAAISRSLAREGFTVALTYRASRPEARSLAREIGGGGVPPPPPPPPGGPRRRTETA